LDDKKAESARVYERKKRGFPRIFTDPRASKKVSLTKREEGICLGFIEIAIRGAIDSILCDRTRDDLVEIAEIVHNEMTNFLVRLHYHRQAERNQT
jgi:hypothetical protein